MAFFGFLSQSCRNLPSRMAKVLPYHLKACVYVRLWLSSCPRACTMHSKSVCWNTSLLCRPWPCPFQTTSHLCQITRQREARKTELAVSKALWTLRPTGTIQWIQYKSDLTASILTINNTLQTVKKKLKGHDIFSNPEVHSTLGFTSICHVWSILENSFGVRLSN